MIFIYVDLCFLDVVVPDIFDDPVFPIRVLFYSKYLWLYLQSDYHYQNWRSGSMFY